MAKTDSVENQTVNQLIELRNKTEILKHHSNINQNSKNKSPTHLKDPDNILYKSKLENIDSSLEDEISEGNFISEDFSDIPINNISVSSIINKETNFDFKKCRKLKNEHLMSEMKNIQEFITFQQKSIYGDKIIENPKTSNLLNIFMEVDNDEREIPIEKGDSKLNSKYRTIYKNNMKEINHPITIDKKTTNSNPKSIFIKAENKVNYIGKKPSPIKNFYLVDELKDDDY